MEEKSRRSGKFNVIDIIILLILVVGIVFVAVKFLGDRRIDEGAGAKIEYTVLVRGVHPDVCETVMAYKNENVQLMANAELVDGYVVDITEAPHLEYYNDAEGNAVVSEEQGPNARRDMTFTIQATVASTVNNKVGTQEVRIGKSHVVKTCIFEMEGYQTTTMTCKVLG